MFRESRSFQRPRIGDIGEKNGSLSGLTLSNRIERAFYSLVDQSKDVYSGQ